MRVTIVELLRRLRHRLGLSLRTFDVSLGILHRGYFTKAGSKLTVLLTALQSHAIIVHTLVLLTLCPRFPWLVNLCSPIDVVTQNTFQLPLVCFQILNQLHGLRGFLDCH